MEAVTRDAAGRLRRLLASFEGLVIEELAAWAAARFVRPGIFFWRTQAGAEVDIG